MNIGLKLLIILWILSRLTDIFSCIVLAGKLQATTEKGKHITVYKMFYALAADAVVTVIIIIVLVPYLVLGWEPPNIWALPWLGVIAISTTAFKTYTKFKLALKTIRGN